jgi:hypothetical protein
MTLGAHYPQIWVQPKWVQCVPELGLEPTAAAVAVWGGG